MLKVGRSTSWRKVVVPVGRQGMDVIEAVGKYIRFGRQCGEWRRENRRQGLCAGGGTFCACGPEVRISINVIQAPTPL